MSVSIWWLVFAWVWGPFIGFFIAAAMHAAKEEDERLKREDPFAEPWQ